MNSRFFTSILLSMFFVASGCVADKKPQASHKNIAPQSLDQQVRQTILPRLETGDILAVGVISELASGNITELGHQLRGKIEEIFTAQGIDVASRSSATDLMGEKLNYGGQDFELEDLEADILVRGTYQKITTESGVDELRLQLKINRVGTSKVVGNISWRQQYEAGWNQLEKNIRGNLHSIELINLVADAENEGPEIAAHITPNPTCLVAGSEIRLHIQSEPGVFLYVFNLAADGSVSILFPNKLMKNNRLQEPDFTFPADGSKQKYPLLVFPMPGARANHESFKVVASRSALDFSFLPQPIDTIYTGAKGGQIKNLSKELAHSTSWSEQKLPYLVSESCTN